MLLLYTLCTLYGPSHGNLNLLPLIFVAFDNHISSSPSSTLFNFCFCHIVDIFLTIGCDSYFFWLANIFHQDGPNIHSYFNCRFNIIVKYILDPLSRDQVLCWHHMLGSINQFKRGILNGYFLHRSICP